MADLTHHKTFRNTDYEILTDEGFKDFEGIIVGKNTNKVKLTFSDGSTLTCTPKHKVFEKHKNIINAKDLKLGDVLYGGYKIIDIENNTNDDDVYDILEVKDNHRYLANGILSHQCLILDELGFVEPASILEDFWRSVYPTISSAKKSKILIASTPNGVGNLFHKLWTGAINGENGFGFDKIEWDEPPGRDEEFKQKTIQSVGYEGWLQEFQNEFLDFGDGAVDHELFDRLKQGCSDPKFTLEDGHLKIFEPCQEGRIYCGGIDTAEGIGKDASVIQIFDITDLKEIKQVAIYYNNRISVYEFTTKAFEILNQWGRPLCFIERNGVGAQVADRFKLQLGYENVVSWGGHLAKRAQQIGMISHSNTKPKAVQNMRYWMNELKCVKLGDIDTLKELKEFTRKPNGMWSAKDGFHDDRVTSMMWCLMALFDEICSQYFEIEERDDNGKPMKISATDWGLTNYINPHSIYTPEALESIDTSLAPVIFGFGNEQDIDEDELHALGWRPLGF